MKAAKTAMDKLGKGVIQMVSDVSALSGSTTKFEDHEAYHKSLVNFKNEKVNSTWEHPHSLLLEPLWSMVQDPADAEMIGQVNGLLAWDAYLVNLLPEGVKDIIVVLNNNCNQSFTYELNGNSAFYRGEGDWHDTTYSKMVKVAPFYTFEDAEKAASIPGHCLFEFNVYPTNDFEENYKTRLPTIMAVVVGCTFGFMLVAFLAYDWFVGRRQNKVVAAAASSNAIVASMFPDDIRDQLIAQKREEQKQQNAKKVDWTIGAGKEGKPLLTDDDMLPLSHGDNHGGAIADFYPDVTLMFGKVLKCTTKFLKVLISHSQMHFFSRRHRGFHSMELCQRAHSRIYAPGSSVQIL